MPEVGWATGHVGPSLSTESVREGWLGKEKEFRKMVRPNWQDGRASSYEEHGGNIKK